MKSDHVLKIAIFCWRDPTNPKAGGAEYVTVRHAQAWIRAGHAVTWFAAAYPGAKKYSTENGIRIHRFGQEKLFFLLAGWQYFWQSREKFDVIIDQVHGLPTVGIWWISCSKKILLIHEVAGEIWQYMFPWPLSTIGRFTEEKLLWLLYRNIPAWVDSYSTKRDLTQVGCSDVRVIPCAVESKIVSALKKESTLTLLFLARIVPMKGVEFALKVFKTIVQLEPDAKLWIVGSGETQYIKQLKNLVQLIGMADHVHFLGKASEREKNKYLRRAHFLLHTSVKEGFGLTVLEAAAQKTPSAIFNVGSLNELVTDNKTGVVAPFHNEQKLAVKIVAAFRNKKLYTKMSEAVYQYQKNFTWRKFENLSTKLVETL